MLANVGPCGVPAAVGLGTRRIEGPDTFDPSIRMFWDGPDVRRCGPVPIGLCCRAEGLCSCRMLRLDSGHNKEWDAPCVGAVYIRGRTAPRRQWVIATLVA